MGAKKSKRARSRGPGPAIAALFWLCVIGWLLATAGSRLKLEGLFKWRRVGQEALPGVSVLSRENWGAEPSRGPMERMRAPRRITVHHLGGKAVADFDRPGAARRIKAIQKEHQDRRKWNDIAYHYVVDRGGRVWEGRPLSQLGAHAGSPSANEANIGVLLLGNFDVQVPSGSQVSSLDRLVRALCRTKGIPRTSVYGHGEVRRQAGLAHTDCPGKHLRKWVEEFRRT